MPLLGDTVLGVAGCLVIAGLTEGIVTTWDLPLGLALGIGLLLAGGFWGLVAWRGRARPLARARSPVRFGCWWQCRRRFCCRGRGRCHSRARCFNLT